MVYFRAAIKVGETSRWQWKSTLLTSLDAVYGFLRMYERVEKERIRVFFASSPVFLKEMLWRENNDQVTNSLLAGQFYRAKGKIDMLEMVRLESEVVGQLENREPMSSTIVMEPVLERNEIDPLPMSYEQGTYDAPYMFTLPTGTQEILIWARLMTSVQSGVLVP